MIVIIDNGEEYSHHSIYFIDIADSDPWAALPFIVGVKYPQGTGELSYVVGMSDHVDWRDPNRVERIEWYWNTGKHHRTCPVYVADGTKPWTPETGPECTCERAKLYAAAQRKRAK